jgi:predicted acetyltransferase/adenylate kinase family enzyme
MPRVVVIGTSCVGKTIFARSLAEALCCPHVELDALYWQPQWVPRPPDEFRALTVQALAQDDWVTDGNYGVVRDLVWSRATTVIWLNYSFPVVLWRAFARTVRRVLTQEELFSGNRESLRMALFSRESILWWVLTTFHRRRKQYRQLFDTRTSRHLVYVELRNPSEAQHFLAGLETAVQTSSGVNQTTIMSDETITLIRPTLALRYDFRSLAEEFFAEGDDRYREATADFEGFIRLCSDEAVGRNLAPGRVPQSTFWLSRNEQRILACSRLRHSLNPYLEEFGGHIGYDVRPSERERGYGTQILKLTLDKAREIGLKRLLVTADSSNVASWRIIEKNGGVLHSEAVSRETGKLLRKYWIEPEGFNAEQDVTLGFDSRIQVWGWRY